MHPDIKHVTWIFYIWIFVLLWRAVCVQGDELELSPSRSREAKLIHSVSEGAEKADKPLRRMKRLEVLEEPAKDEPQLSPQIRDVTGGVTTRGVNQNDAKDKISDEVLQIILEQIHKAAIEHEVHVVEPKTPPQPLDTGQEEDNIARTTPQPLDTIPDSRNTSKIRKPKQNKTQVVDTNLNVLDIAETDPIKYRGKTRENTQDINMQSSQNAHNKEEVIVGVEIKVENGGKTSTNSNVNNTQYLKTEVVGEKIGTSSHDIGKASSLQSNKNLSAKDETLRFVKKQPVLSNNTGVGVGVDRPATSQVKSGKSLKLVSYEEFVQNVANQKNNLTIDKPFNQDNVNLYRDRLNRNNAIKQTRQQSLILLQNATKEAEDIQQRLKNHKLKLKSYIEELKNVNVLDNEENKKATSRKNYTDKVREKVKDIVNPQRQMNHSAPKEHGTALKPHFFAKDIPETLRARVDMKVLKKSESFWDKKGEDVEEPHLTRSSMNEQTLQEENLDMEKEDELDLDTVVVDYSDQSKEREGQEAQTAKDRTTTSAPTRTDDDVISDHLNDYNQIKLNEIHVTKDRLKARTQHEMFIMSQMLSGRIHGNVLAPPPERCSVKANMKRYRPPEEEMDEDESLLYRAKLQPEKDAAIEGAPMDYLEDYKNPCWLSKITDDKGTLWYDYTETGLTYKRMSFLYEMRLSKGSNWRMRCLPYLYFVGVTKSGTTDLYSRLMGHPDIMRPGHKEPMWWNRLTLGMAESLRKPFRYYVDFFDEAAELIRRKVVMKDGKPYHPAVTVDATPANLWDYDCWTDIPGNRGLAEPKYTLAHSIKKLVPNAKIVMILREPTSRLYSQYRMKSYMEPSSTFHKLVMEAVVNFNQCLETRTLRSCAYDYEISKHEFQSPGGVFIRASLYYVFVKDWLDVFSSDQVKVIRTEDYQNNTEDTLHEVFDFMNLSPLPNDRLHAISRQRSVNTRADHLDRSMEPMLPETKRLLDDFFRPYNKMLAKLLHSKKWKWNDVTSMK